MPQPPGEPELPQPTDTFRADAVRAVAEAFITPRPTVETPRDRELLQTGVTLPLDCGLAATAWGDGPTVLLAHGWESRRSHWAAFVPALVAAGFRAVAIDAPAHGDSPGRRVNVLEYGRAIAETGMQLGRLAGVVGHSFGAIASIVAMHRGLAVDRAVIISGPPCLVTLANRFGANRNLDAEQTAEFVRLVEQEVGFGIESVDLRAMARESAAPTLIVHDTTDEDIPLPEAFEPWPGATRLVTERFGHRRILIAKEVVRQVIAFLDKGVTPG